MRLRTAIKICRIIYGGDLKRMNQRVHMNYCWKHIDKARRVCNRGKRWLKDKRLPYIPSIDELHEQAEIFGCLMFDLAKELGMPEEEVERKREEFLMEMSSET